MRGVRLSLVLLLILCGGTLQAGVDPSPFLPQIRELEAIEHVLLVTYAQEDRLLSAPPKTQLPPRPLVVQLEAIQTHLAIEEGQIVRVVTPILIDGLAPEEVVPALEGVESAAGMIRNRAAEGFTYPPGDPEVFEALSAVEAQAGNLVDATSSFVPGACPCWTEEEIALLTGSSQYPLCVLGFYNNPYDFLLFELWYPDPFCEDVPPGEPCEDWIEARATFDGEKYSCHFGQWDYPSVGDRADRFEEITQEVYETCRASIIEQAAIEQWPLWCHP